jgi:hypothetical protein
MNENPYKLYKSIKAGSGLAEKTTGHIFHEIAKGNVKLVAIKDGCKLDVEFIWILHALAWKFCNQTWISEFIRTKQLPSLTEEGMHTIKELEESAERFKRNQGISDKQLILAQEDFLNKYNPGTLLRYFPFVIIQASEIKKYLDRQKTTNDTIYEMVEKFGSVNLKGTPFIWPRIPGDHSDRVWEKATVQGGMCDIYIYPDAEFLEPLAPTETPKGRKKIVNGRKEDTVDYLFVFNFGGHAWGQSFLKSCILRRVNLIDRDKAYKMRKDAQLLCFTMLWIQDHREEKFWLHEEEICKLLHWKYPQERMKRLRSRIKNLLVYMWDQGALKKYPRPKKERWPIVPDPWFTKKEKPPKEPHLLFQNHVTE